MYSEAKLKFLWCGVVCTEWYDSGLGDFQTVWIETLITTLYVICTHSNETVINVSQI